MELSFIWVEKFRNIENLGLNFSSQYRFTYNKDTNNLYYQSNDTYLPNFFSRDISNISALIGQNASGKTNILELVIYLMNGGKSRLDQSFIMVFKNQKGKLIGYNHGREAPNPSNIKFNEYEGQIEGIDTLFFSNVFDGRRHNFDPDTKDLSTNNLINYKFGENFHTLYNNEIRAQVKFISSKQFSILENIEQQLHPNLHTSFYPTHIRISSPSWGFILSKARGFDKIVSNYFSSTLNSLELLCRSFRSALLNKVDDETSFRILTGFLVYLDYMLSNFASREKNSSGKITVADKKSLSKLLLKNPKDKSPQELFEWLLHEVPKHFTKKNEEIINRTRFFEQLGSRRFSEINRQDQGKYSSRKNEFLIGYEKKIGDFVCRYLDSIASTTLSYSIEWEGISSGHKAYISLFSRFHEYSKRKRNKKKFILLCIDEGDLYFHPKWQTEFLYKLINILPAFVQGEKLQILLTTHSPFLVSDLPKNNLIFLRKNDDGLLQTVPPEQIEGQTFGGNIGELYLDAFFLNGTLISEFALHKINELVKGITTAIKSKTPITPDQLKLVDQIGEILIRNKLKEMINDSNTK